MSWSTQPLRIKNWMDELHDETNQILKIGRPLSLTNEEQFRDWVLQNCGQKIYDACATRRFTQNPARPWDTELLNDVLNDLKRDAVLSTAELAASPTNSD